MSSIRNNFLPGGADGSGLPTSRRSKPSTPTNQPVPPAGDDNSNLKVDDVAQQRLPSNADDNKSPSRKEGPVFHTIDETIKGEHKGSGIQDFVLRKCTSAYTKIVTTPLLGRFAQGTKVGNVFKSLDHISQKIASSIHFLIGGTGIISGPITVIAAAVLRFAALAVEIGILGVGAIGLAPVAAVVATAGLIIYLLVAKLLRVLLTKALPAAVLAFVAFAALALGYVATIITGPGVLIYNEYHQDNKARHAGIFAAHQVFGRPGEPSPLVQKLEQYKNDALEIIGLRKKAAAEEEISEEDIASL